MFLVKLACCALLCAALGALTWALERAFPGPDAVETETNTAEAVRLPVLMYHSILKNPARQGPYILSPDALERDLVYLSGHGYESVSAAQLIAYADGTGTLPDKPVLITFDDGHMNNLHYALPILERTGHCAVVSVVGAYCERYTREPDPNPNYAYLSWDEVRRLAGSGRVEIGSHSYDMHGQTSRQGASRMRGESSETYRRAFLEDASRMQMLLYENAGVAALVYAYPFGLVSKESVEALESLGVRCTLTCREVVSNVVRGKPDTLFGLGRFNRSAGESTEAFMARALGG